jgi:hypothetical protein
MDGQLDHVMVPKATRDEAARQAFVGALRKHMQGSLTPGNQAVYHARIKPAFVEAQGREPANRQGRLDDRGFYLHIGG